MGLALPKTFTVAWLDMHTTPVSLLLRLHRPSAEPEAWPKFVELYTPLLFACARRLGLRAQDAADLVQDVFTVLVQKLPEFDYQPGKSFRAWLWTVMVNKYRENLRRPRAVPLPDAHGVPLENLASPEPPDALEEAEYRQYLVSRALQLMQADFQPVTWKACWEFVVDDKPAAEVAAKLGISVKAVYMAKFRVLRWLRQELDGLLD
jgi:RNA polymerase sigma-70 factor (ECF subfamily)